MRSVLAAVVLAALALTGCGNPSNGSEPAGGQTAGNGSDASGTAIDIRIKGDTITPNGERVPVASGEPVTLHVTSDRAGELHVHSTPEQELEFDKGETTLPLTIDKPGIVDVEDHSTESVVVQLEVS